MALGILTIQMDKSAFEASGLSGNTRLIKGQHIWNLRQDVNVLECTAETQISQDITSPPPALDVGSSIWKASSRAEVQEAALHIYEWLSLFRLESPRVQSGDHIDKFLSRYEVASSVHGKLEQMDVCRISWVGLIGATWFQNLVCDVLAVHPAEGWLSVISNSFHDVSLTGNGSELVILRPSTEEDRYLMWTLNNSV
ncbi:hypothetical protein E4U54_006679 [Claviceps lovelessii]|nr:hypothetical protein E4U54_006679 [Claviceps lovelessii]